MPLESAGPKPAGVDTDAGVAGREVLGALDLMLRGYDPPPGAHWGGLLAKTNLPVAKRKISRAINALTDIRTLLTPPSKIATANAVQQVTITALKTHFKLVPSGGTKLAREGFITLATIDPLLANFRGIQSTLANPKMIRHSICTNGLDTAAEAPLGVGPILFGPPYSDFTFDPDTVGNVTNIKLTGPNSLAAMTMHEATHVIDRLSGVDATTHISEFTLAYETQTAANARHNPSAFATFAAHIDEGADRPRADRFGLSPDGTGRPL